MVHHLSKKLIFIFFTDVSDDIKIQILFFISNFQKSFNSKNFIFLIPIKPVHPPNKYIISFFSSIPNIIYKNYIIDDQIF
jgi:hypothetical protein